MKNPLVSIVTICWNRKQDILDSLQGISQVEYDNLEVIVVDNDSNDDTCEAIEENYPNVKLIKMYKNIGIEAYNIGFKNAKGKYIVIVDDDSFPEKHAVKRMVEKFENDEELGIVAFDVRNYYKYDEVAVVDEISEAAEAKDYLMAFNGAGAGIRRELFEEVGFYPEEFFLYWNEQDTAFRVLDKGYKIIFYSDIVSYHKYSPKNRSSWRAPYYYTRNAFLLVWKNYPLEMVFEKTIYLIYKSLYSSLEQHSFIYIKGMCAAFREIQKIKGKRRPVKKEIAKKLRIPLDTAFTFFR
jgi:GT2 family glycosyltransferase